MTTTTSLASLHDWLAAHGAGGVHRRRLLRDWTQARDTGTATTGAPASHGGAAAPGPHALRRARRAAGPDLPAPLRAALPAWRARLDALAALRASHGDADGAQRLEIGLADGRTVETVRLPPTGPRGVGSVCVSTQVGCAVGCGFCLTGTMGLQRQLGSAEIVAQVALARRAGPVGRVLFMGMGEPAHNLDATLEAIAHLGSDLGGFAHHDLVVSTVGDERLFERLPQATVRPALALSLHSTVAERRALLLPRAPRIAPAELVTAADAYGRAIGCPVQVQWTLLAGVNDGDDEVAGLVALLRGRRMMLNLIAWNAVDGMPWQRPAPERIDTMTRQLAAAGVLTRVRHSAGQGVQGGCGQLAARPSLPARSPGPPPARVGRPVPVVVRAA